MMRSYFLVGLLFYSIVSYCQKTDPERLSRISGYMKVLTSDSLKGRGNFTGELFKAAKYIAGEFQTDSLQNLPGFDTYLLPFTIEKQMKPEWLDSNGNYELSKIMFNVVGVLEGRSLPNEVVIFGAHYDHMGVIKKKKRGDSIFNGANDNASGTAAVMAIANYYARRRDNERTLVFCLFAGEEIGLFGSKIFSQYLKPESIVTMINIEMIGRHDAAGRNNFFITGAEYSNLGQIIEKNLKGTGSKLTREPDPELLLFQRSDNISFAVHKIPAHTIMCSSDGDQCYHQTCDELSRIDLQHMENIVNAIIVSTKPIVDGKETPERIKKRVEAIF